MDSARCSQSPSSRSAHTTQAHNTPLGWAEIRHPFHPLRGQSLLVLKKLRIAGVDTFFLRGPTGNLYVPREWTDRADPDPYLSLEVAPHFAVDQLLELTDLVDKLSVSPRSYS